MTRTRSAFFGLLCFGILFGTVAADDTAAPHLPIESYRLPNGLKVALSRDPRAPQVTVCVAYHVGSKNERPGLTGFAHFFEHMMFRGTKNVPSYDTPLQAGGGSPNAFTTNDMTVYFETIPASYLERALYMEAERMAYLPAALDQKKFDTEREVVKNERRQRMENVPYGLAEEAIEASLFPKGHPYSWSVIGSMKDLDRATLDDLRRFFWEFYHPGNATLTIVGNFDPANAKAWIERYFGPIPAGRPIAPVNVPPTPVVDRRMRQFDQVRFPRVYWSWPTVSETHPDAPALDLLAEILSDGDASRLRQALMIRKQLAVQVTAQSDTREVGGLFTIFATVSPRATMAQVEDVLAEQLARLREEGPSPEEVQRAFAKHENGVLQMLTSTTSRAFVIGMGYSQYDDPHFYRRLISDYVSVTPADIRRVARKYLTEQKLVLEVVSPKPGVEESAAILAGPIAGTHRDVAPRTMPVDPRYAKMPAPSKAPPLVIPAVERHRLSNGLQVLVARWTTLPLVAVRLVVPAGGAASGPEEAGLAMLTARSWDKGTRSMDATEFAAALDRLGVALNVGAGTQTTQVGFSVSTRRLVPTLELVGQMLVEPRFDAKDIARERALMLSSLARIKESPERIAGRVFPTLLYGKQHPFGRPVSGYSTTVAKLTPEQVRRFYHDHLRPQNATLVVVGDVETKSLLKNLEATFGAWKGKPTTTHVPPVTSAEPTPEITLVDAPKAVQSVIVIGRRWTARRDPDYFPAVIGNRIIGGDFVSRINKNLRERNGYTYGARSGFRFLLHESRWVLQTSVRADATGPSLREALKELREAIRNRPLTDEEIATAKAAQRNSLPKSFGTPSGIAGNIVQIALFELPLDYMKTQFTQLDAVTPDQVRATARKLLPPESQHILIVGDRQQVTRQLKELGFDRIILVDSDGDRVGGD